MKQRYCAFAYAVSTLLALGAAELFNGNDWKKVDPASLTANGWNVQNYKGKSNIVFSPAKDKTSGSVAITLKAPDGSGAVFYNKNIKFPAGSTITFSGEYKTEGYVKGKKGQFFTYTSFNYGSKDDKNPQFGELLALTPSATWKTFSVTAKYPRAAKGPFRAYFYASGEQGTVQFRNPSLQIKEVGKTTSAATKNVVPACDYNKLSPSVNNGWQIISNGKAFSGKGESGYALLSYPTVQASGRLQYSSNTFLPAGTWVTFSGEYKTGNVVFEKGGMIAFSVMCRNNPQSATAPSTWINAAPRPSSEWTKFKVTKRIPFDVRTLSIYASMAKASGTLAVRALSVEAKLPTDVPNPKAEYIWREMEDFDPLLLCSDWGKEISPDYFSGRGGVCIPKKNLDWNFNISAVTDEKTLFPKNRTFHIWTRVYGYTEAPRFYIFHQDRFLQYSDTPPNEVLKKGKYAGPGIYTWVYGGSFDTRGGAHKLSFQPVKGRMLADAVLLTTDADYAPVLFEAKKMPQTRCNDIRNAHNIKAEYLNEGVTDTICLPVSFRIGGKNRSIKANEKPAVFHFSLPKIIQVKGVTSHWAGETWGTPGRGAKCITWKKTGTRKVNGRDIVDYEAELTYLSSNQYLIFVQAESQGFKVGDTSIMEYWLEEGREKQLKEQIALKHIRIQPASPFKNIYIGPSYVPFRMMYVSYPDLFNNMKKCGFNFIGAWGEPWNIQNFDRIRNEIYSNGFRLAMVVPQYTGVKPEHVAFGMNGKPLTKESGQGRASRILTLSLDENDAPIRETMERTKRAAAYGVSVEYDDEMTNVLYDLVDYHPKTKALFKEWLKKNGKGCAYAEPEQIVKNKKNDPAMYKIWVDFKCSRMTYWYSLYRKAFEEGLKSAKGKYPANAKPLMWTCIQGGGKDFRTAEDIKESGFFDYKTLSQHCDLIELMSYTYGGVAQSAQVGDCLEMYSRYLKKDVTFTVLLAGGYGTETGMKDKVMLKYQVWEALMQKSKMIVFYAGATVFNAPTLLPVTDAIRIARPYEDFFVNGTRYYDMKADKGYVRLKALRLGDKVLLYAANYTHGTNDNITVTFPQSLKSVFNCENGKKLSENGEKFTFDFKNSRGILFLVEM